MNVPTTALIDKMLVLMGTDSTALGNGSIGLIAAPFSASPGLLLTDITEANYSGYARQGFGNPSVPFTSTDGLEYVQGLTVNFTPNDTVTVNTIYGAFATDGNSTITLRLSDHFDAPIPMTGPSSRITITPRFGLSPAAGLGLNVVSD